MHLGIAPSATHNYSKTFFINSKCFVVVFFFLPVSFLCFYPSLSKGFTYTYCVLPHTAILNNFSLIFVIVSLVFSEACLCFTFNLFIVYLNFLSFLCILNNFVATLASPEKLSKKIINRRIKRIMLYYAFEKILVMLIIIIIPVIQRTQY